ncbi:MAG: type I 3-dehydroquinate dehydratase [Akkermansiaceae bacterium]
MSAAPMSLPERPQVVGSVANLNQLACLQPIELPELCDVLEVRLDGISDLVNFKGLVLELERLKNFPILLTARSEAEGGLVSLSDDERSQLLLATAKYATWIDVELASYEAMAPAIHEIRSQGVGLILSYHNFERTPPEFELQRIIDLGEEADIVKIAMMHHSTDDFSRCLRILENNDHPLAIMGMGELGAISRLLYAKHGSLLNYGYLGEQPTAPGQWPAPFLKKAILV